MSRVVSVLSAFVGRVMLIWLCWLCSPTCAVNRGQKCVMLDDVKWFVRRQTTHVCSYVIDVCCSYVRVWQTCCGCGTRCSLIKIDLTSSSTSAVQCWCKSFADDDDDVCKSIIDCQFVEHSNVKTSLTCLLWHSVAVVNDGEYWHVMLVLLCV